MTMRVPQAFVVVAMCGLAGCFGNRGSGGAQPGEPDAVTDRWRAVVGCYDLPGEQFVLDSVPEARLNRGRAGVRQARVAPRPAIVGAYWYVDRDGDIWLFRHDGLWGMSYEFKARGDSLVGVRWVGTDVPDSRPRPVPATAVRSASCPPPPGANPS